MPAAPKVFIHNTVVEISTRMKRGLPMVCTPYMQVIIEGILAAACEKYPVIICHYLFMGNHFHMIIVVIDPADVPRFVGYVKKEITKSINRLHGVRKRDLWEVEYSSPTVQDVYKLIERLNYTYQNPVRAGLTRSISKYPGVSSYAAFLNGGQTKWTKKVSLDSIPELSEEPLSINQQKRLASTLSDGPGVKYKLKVEPFACFNCFREKLNKTDQEIVSQFLEAQKRAEESYAREKKTVLGVSALKRQDPRQDFYSEPTGRKMWCLCSFKEHRKAFIDYMKGKVREQRTNYEQWKSGNKHSFPPAGFFAPGGMLFSYIVPCFLPFLC